MELSNKSLGALDVLGRVPLIFFNTIPLPVYWVLDLSTEDPTIKDAFNFVLFDAIVDDRRWWWRVALLSFGDWVTLEGA